MPSNDFNILLADDDKDDCMLFKEALQEIEMPTKLTTVHDGTQLMQYLLENTEQLPDVIFLDLNMPRKNGFTCLREIMRNKKLKSVPVIIFSTSYDENIAELLYESGAQNYICKPADFSELKNVIQQALTLVKENNISQPLKENFLLNNIKTILFGHEKDSNNK